MNERTLPDQDMLRKKLSYAMSSLNGISNEKADLMRRSNTYRWSASMLSLWGSSLSRERAISMAADIAVPEATLQDRTMLYACQLLRSEFDLLYDLQTVPDVRMIYSFHATLSGLDRPAELRKGSHVINEMNHVTPHGSQLPELMDEIGRVASGFLRECDPIAAAARIHDMIISAWPFDENTGPTAYAVMSYCLMLAGYPLPCMDINEYDHLRLAAEYAHAGTSNGLISMLLISSIKECRT